LCPFCSSKDTPKLRWTWARYEKCIDTFLGVTITYPKFVSRSTGYRCWNCGEDFIYYAKNYGVDREIENYLVAIK
jgi:DNA-directed RNA polymerase subunit RPC12/RpoP